MGKWKCFILQLLSVLLFSICILSGDLHVGQLNGLRIISLQNHLVDDKVFHKHGWGKWIRMDTETVCRNIFQIECTPGFNKALKGLMFSSSHAQETLQIFPLCPIVPSIWIWPSSYTYFMILYLSIMEALSRDVYCPLFSTYNKILLNIISLFNL